jgi:hypothetical protein
MKHPNFLTASQCAEDVLVNLPSHWDGPLESYGDCLRAAFTEFDPIFTKEHYADFYLKCSSEVPAWIPSNILANAKKESDGAKLLYEFWRRVRGDALLENDVMFHIKDEIRHSKLFIALTELAFPQVADQPFIQTMRNELFSLNESEATKHAETLSQSEITDHLVQMNLGEIRTRVHISMIAPLISAFSPLENRSKVEKILAALVDDETAHIAYTAKHLEKLSQSVGAEELKKLFLRRLRDLHEYTVYETRAAVSEYAPEMVAALLH